MHPFLFVSTSAVLCVLGDLCVKTMARAGRPTDYTGTPFSAGKSAWDLGNLTGVIDWVAKRKWWLFALILLAILAGCLDRWLTRRDHSQDKPILAAALRYQVDPALVKAVVWQESRFDPLAQGKKGEIGLMQLSEIAAQEWADAEKLESFRHEDLFDPFKNTLAGTWYLGKMIRRYAHTDSPYHYALADYNAGRTHVLRWNKGAASTNSQIFLKQIDYPGTRRYVELILRKYQRYRKQFADQTS